MSESTRGKISEIAARLAETELALKALPQSPTAYQAVARLREAVGLVRLLGARTPEPAPRRVRRVPLVKP